MAPIAYTAIIVAAGRGERAGAGLPKQLRRLGDRPVLAWSVERFAADPDCEAIIVVGAPERREAIAAVLKPVAHDVRLVDGGATRSDSVRAGLNAAQSAYVLIHDAARPLVSDGLIDRLKQALKHTVAAAPALPVPDALVSVRDGVEPVDRAWLRRMQTPQAFRRSVLQAAFAAAGGESFADEVSVARADGVEVALVDGEESNFKLTWPDDFARAQALLATPTLAGNSVSITGQGYDVHRLAPGDGLTLCGVRIDCALRLVGHSDADVGLHALTDAVLGAAGDGDIGQHFPPSDPQWAGADSAAFLQHALKRAAERGLKPLHADLTLICERPKIGPHREAMRQRVAALVGLDPARVNIKATTTEGLGFTGRGEGLAAQAVFTALIQPRHA